MKVAAGDVAGAVFDVGDPEAFGDEVGDAGFDLEFARDAEEGFGFGEDFVAPENLFPYHEVDEAGFVFEGHEDDAFGGAGALAADDEAGVADTAAAFHVLDGGGVGEALALEFVA